MATDRRDILVNVIQCLQILLEESSGAFDPTLVNTVARIKELNPDRESDHLFLWEFRDNIQAIWESRSVQVRVDKSYQNGSRSNVELS